MQRFLNYAFFLILIGIISCAKDKLPAENEDCTIEVTYQSDIKPIIDKSCAYAGCHVVGFIKGNHTSYTSLKPQLDNGLFKKWVLDERQMPPQYAPADKPKSLTQEEINLINCWVKSGYPE